MNDKYVEVLLKHIHETYGVIIGFDDKYNDLVKYDFNRLLELRYGVNNENLQEVKF